jgi:hypothetical protein
MNGLIKRFWTTTGSSARGQTLAPWNSGGADGVVAAPAIKKSGVALSFANLVHDAQNSVAPMRRPGLKEALKKTGFPMGVDGGGRMIRAQRGFALVGSGGPAGGTSAVAVNRMAHPFHRLDSYFFTSPPVPSLEYRFNSL